MLSKSEQVASLRMARATRVPAKSCPACKGSGIIPTNERADTKTRQRPDMAKNKTVKPGTKLAKIVKLLTRDEGCTLADARKATGWRGLSFNQQAKAAGLKLRKVRRDGVTRYWGY